MIKLIIHCADIHIRNFMRHEEYAEQFEKFIDKCKEITQTYDKNEVRIVIAGDLFHQKNTISNELMVFTSLFLRQLEDIATVIVISGNHDMLVNNTSRTDTLTALFNTADFGNCKFLDMMLDYESGCVVDDNVTWAVYSIYSDYMRPSIEEAKSKNPNNKIIGLYHGMVVGAKLPNGTIVDSGCDGELFDGCDFVLAGHIHKHQSIKRGNTEIVFPSSLIQQTFGETVTQHGFEVWNVENNTHEFMELDSNYGLYNIEINNIDDIDNDKEKLINF